MRTTLDLNDALARRAEEAAAREQTTLTRLIEEGPRLRLRPSAPPAGGQRAASRWRSRCSREAPGWR